MRAERLRERLYLEDGITDSTWLGAVTDGAVWYVWEWDPQPSEIEGAPRPVRMWQGQGLNSGNLGRLAGLFDRESVGREWATPDMSHAFSDILESMHERYGQLRGTGSVRTQRGLWLEQLKGGGNSPEGEEGRLFVLHSLLILISKLISSETDPREGFVQWVPDSEIGRLAEIICSEIIDDGFIEEQIRKFESGGAVSGVLDPACGSGTFLYHAARRVMESGPVRASYLGREKIAALVCRMIRGMDIHPVAVEMAKANMRRLLPRASHGDVIVYQGDALLTPRPEAALFGYSGSALPLSSPKGLHLVLPGWFVLSDSGDISRFVESACDDTAMPPSLGVDVRGYDRGQLACAHDQLRKIVREESDGVWFWYILNQAGPMRLRGTIGRTVSNPPWVSYDKIQEARRKEEIRRMAEERRLWVGGKNNRFDLAALFVDRCPELYETAGAKSAWVLPRSAMRADTWKGLRDKAGKKMSGSWDLGNLPFSTNSCVVFFGHKTRDRKLSRTGGKLRASDSWEAVSGKTEWSKAGASFAERCSEWTDGRGRNLARKGASIIPHCLVWAGSVTASGGTARVRTKPARWPPWRDLGVMDGDVPESWIRDCASAGDLAPYSVPGVTRCVLPIDGDGWDAGRGRFRFWRDARDQYAAHRGAGAHTPKTLEARLDFNGAIFKQLGRTGEHVAYNKAGSTLYAARIPNKRIIHDTLYWKHVISVSCA